MLAGVPDLRTPSQDGDYTSEVEDAHMSSSNPLHGIAEEIHSSKCTLSLSCHFLSVGVPEQLAVHPDP